MDKLSKQQNHRAFRTEFLSGAYRSSPGLKKTAFFAIIVAGSLLLSTCGIEEYPYLEPIREDAIQRELNSRATIPLPNVSSLFTNFVIYYRIYISGENMVSEILDTDMTRINSTLYQDYNNFLPYTKSDSTTISTSVGTLFANRRYYSLYARSVDMNNLLSLSSMGQVIEINFAPVNGRQPTIELGGTEYILWRTTGGERSGEATFDIKPDDRSFINTQDLNSSENAASTATSNKDVADNTVSGPRYTYVSMYIMSTGHDLVTFNPVYSQPAHIGVFRLPEP
jgi:hypothetical protein